ncbi:hypothetical protein AB1288_07620 [Pseudomonas putida]|uniref:AbiU2 domain-containing protein n=1 Tax=Pseudomonas putida TaxID=303 RepID=UPI00345D504E
MLSHEEVRAQCMEAMGAKLGAMYCDLNDHLLDLCLIWKQYEQLFTVDQETVMLLNKSAPTFFGVIQSQLWDSVILGISRLTDPPEMRSNKNLSIKALLPLIADDTVHSKVQELCSQAESAAEFARNQRHKRIAHNDLAHIRDKSAHPLIGASREKIKESLDSICAVLESINGHYRESTMLYEDLIFDGGPGALVALMRDGLAHRELEEQELDQ